MVKSLYSGTKSHPEAGQIGQCGYSGTIPWSRHVAKSFSPYEYAATVGELLVMEFEFARKLATTPGLIGEAMEHPVRNRLEQLLPRGLAAGSGCVIDTQGNTSKQIDIVLFERDICPVFTVNDTPDSTYYPCEGVVAVGEIKSSIGKQKMEDSFEKIKSVKRLRRNYDEPKLPAHPEKGTKVYTNRKYGQTADAEIVDVNYNPYEDEFSEIFAFVLGGKLEIKPETMFAYYAELINATEDALCPNITAFLSGELIFPNKLWQDSAAADSKQSIRSANSILFQSSRYPFGLLVSWLYNTYRNGRTAHVNAFGRYFQRPDHTNLPPDNRTGRTTVIKGRTALERKPVVRGLL